MIKLPHQKAFTLVEILVVVSVIASISSVVLVGLKAAQASGRDSARQSSALQVRSALALYATDHGGVPAATASTPGCNPVTSGGTTSYVCKGSLGTPLESGVLAPLVPKYISHIPVDMVNTNGLEYSYITAVPDPVLTAANGGSPTTPTATFAYVSELKSVDPVSNPVVVATPIGESNYSSYGSSGYPSGSLIASPSITSFTGPSTLTSNTVGTWTVGVSNPNGTTLTHSFNWGDTTTDSLTSTGSSLNVSHTYATTGSYTATITVSGSGSPVTASLVTTVSPPACPGCFTLTVNNPSNGAMSISSSPAGITSCTSASCSAQFSGGTRVTLTATQSSSYTIQSWSSGGDPCYTSSTGSGATYVVNPYSCNIIVNQTDLVTPNLLSNIPITITKSGTGIGTVVTQGPASQPVITCGPACTTPQTAYFAAGTSLLVVPTAASGSSFRGYTATYSCSGGQIGCPVSIPVPPYFGATSYQNSGPQTVNSEFDIDPTLTISKSGAGTVTDGSGTINCGVTCSKTLPWNSTTVLTASPSNGSSFVGWSGTGECSGMATTCTLYGGTTDISAVATFTSAP